MSTAPSSTAAFLERFRNRVASLPELVGRVKIDETVRDGGPTVVINIPKSDAAGFDIEVAFFDNWEIFVFADQSTVSFFLSNKARHNARNSERIDASIAFVLNLLGPRHRLRQSYCGKEVYRGVVEERVATGWKVVARYGRLMLWRHLFSSHSEKVFQNTALTSSNHDGTA
jgi:hypothetical protein